MWKGRKWKIKLKERAANTTHILAIWRIVHYNSYVTILTLNFFLFILGREWDEGESCFNRKDSCNRECSTHALQGKITYIFQQFPYRKRIIDIWVCYSYFCFFFSASWLNRNVWSWFAWRNVCCWGKMKVSFLYQIFLTAYFFFYNL